jgi:HSP20 family molecular chaperone IbpA
VHSHPAKYRIELNMPLIDRDAVTISTRRAQTLHIAGDGWERGGGHFERKVRFGWDADLTRVSAEFEGDKLIVGVPRKPSGLQGQVGTPMPMGASV